MIALASPSLPRTTARPTAMDRLIVQAGRTLAHAGRRIAVARVQRITSKAARQEADRSAAAHRDAAIERLRDNAAQINPLGLR